MKIQTQRRLDATLGVLFCFIASSSHRVYRCFRSKRQTEPGERLLIVKLSEQGAIVILGDSFRRLRQHYAQENMWFLAFGVSRDILRAMHFVPDDNLLFISTKSFPEFIRTSWRAMRIIRHANIDTVLDLEFFSRASALIAWLSGASRRVGVHAYFHDGQYRGDLMTHRVKYNPHLHISQMIRTMAEAVFLPDGQLPTMDFVPPPVAPLADRFVPTAEMSAEIDELLKACDWRPGERIALVNANISDRELIPLRRWSEANFAQVARDLVTEFDDVRVLLTGAPNEAAAINALAGQIALDKVRSVAGRTSLRGLLTLYTRSALMVTNDSGPAHFATITDMGVVVLFGPETPQLWRPLGERVRVVYRGLACSPCFTITNGRQSSCRNNMCMNISPSEVLAVARDMLRPGLQLPQLTA